MPDSQSGCLYDKILGSLAAAGMGDALGAPTELYQIDEIMQTYGGMLKEFVTPPKDTFAGDLGSKKAQVTDDASQMYVLAKGLIDAGYGSFTNEDWVRCLLTWADMQPYANYKGPTTEAVIAALKQGRPTNTIGRIGQSERQAPQVGITNGAGMRVAPVGLINPGKIKQACDLALLTCLPSHDTSIAIASACAIAAAVSQALIPSSSVDDIIHASLEGAKYGEQLANRHGRVVAGASIELKIRLAVSLSKQSTDTLTFLKILEGHVGNSVIAHESIPCALGIFAFTKGHVMDGIIAAANIGNDTDSIATMVGAIAGAYQGFSAIPQDMYKQWHQTNQADFDIETLSEGLCKLAQDGDTNRPKTAGKK